MDSVITFIFPLEMEWLDPSHRTSILFKLLELAFVSWTAADIEATQHVLRVIVPKFMTLMDTLDSDTAKEALKKKNRTDFACKVACQCIELLSASFETEINTVPPDVLLEKVIIKYIADSMQFHGNDRGKQKLYERKDRRQKMR